MSTIKNWAQHTDLVLSELCGRVIERRLLKIRLQANPVDAAQLKEKQVEVRERYGVSADEAAYLAFTGEASNTLYNPGDERIRILFKDGMVRDISEVDHALIQQGLSGRVKKHYICYPGA
jgi:hypothetical protein